MGWFKEIDIERIEAELLEDAATASLQMKLESSPFNSNDSSNLDNVIALQSEFPESKFQYAQAF